MQKVLDVAKGEVGYLEKKSNAQLDSKTANVGFNNYTKYGKAQGCNGQAWCDAFVDWCFIQAYGKDKAKQLLGGFSNYTPTSAQYFKNMKQWHTYPQKGDVIFFKNSQRICHTGIVYKVSDGVVYTIEGNTGGGSDVIANGGGVYIKQYSISNTRIAGYGRPNYDAKTSVVAKPTLRYGNSGNAVKELQTILNSKGYDCGKIDGIFGNQTEKAVFVFQKTNKLTVDGIVGPKTWEKLL